jgi:hypothetical protein
MFKYFFILLLLLSCERGKKNIIIENQESIFTKIIPTDTFTLKPFIDTISKLIKEGDIIFRGGTDIESNIIRDFSYTDKLFSHCGIIVKKDSGLVVAHMLGGTDNPNGSLLFSNLKEYLKYPFNESAGIYSFYFSDTEKTKLHKYLDSIKNKNIGFDLKFNLFTKDVLYCTEMIADAVSYAKPNSQIFKPTIFNLKNTKYFFLANKNDSFYFYPIDKFQKNKMLKLKRKFYFPNYGANVIKIN